MWTLKSEDRLHEWKVFRQTISVLPFEEAILKTVNLWSYAPFVKHHIDKQDVSLWPNPWELLQENKYDDTARALAMLYTLGLSDHGKDHTFSLDIMQASTQLENYNLVNIDNGAYILNYSFNEVTRSDQLDTTLTLTNSYTADHLQLNKY